ncbi:uncharacterized protein TNCV_1815901 [Trichonephila clavipes]|nr:uncharacterized protein TNCV_1815901 [Trichonephila clavipes]
MFEGEILPLYGKDIYKVELRMNKASSHTPKSTATYLSKKKKSEAGMKCIPFNEIRVKLLYASAMDFSAFGLLKRALGKRYPITLSGLRKTFQEE